jgi:hypothetical protein
MHERGAGQVAFLVKTDAAEHGLEPKRPQGLGDRAAAARAIIPACGRKTA